ncbi:adenylosuccinate synthase [Candidatus Woesebacteria bacterium RBG_19FT_COMBO_47_8]|nr:MAG: adenylosuccinate synthase [Candidatus Woesebacteria bacterium RBG_19FT_COMBO_47_8]
MTERLSRWRGTNVVLDTTWGDSGKGKLVDVMAQRAKMVVRFNGGPNAGHTVKNEHGEFKFHQIPSGIFNPEAISVIAQTVAVNPNVLLGEIAELKAKGIEVSKANLLVSEEAHLIMPWHIQRDRLRETARGEEKIGTTGQGIGPVFADRTERVGLKVKDILDPRLPEILAKELAWQEKLTQLMLDTSEPQYDYDSILEDLRKAADTLAPMISQVLPLIRLFHKRGNNILGEGAQGALLDLDLGGYPFVTSTHPTLSGFSQATGIYANISRIIGVTKAYQTRVGEGPMPTELENEIGATLRERGKEYGATTGRPRRCGWIDIPAIRYGAMISGVKSLAITKLDVLDSFDEIRICAAYRDHGHDYKFGYPDTMARAVPIYINLKGWREDTSGAKDIRSLPEKCSFYLTTIQELVGLPVEFVSVGPERNQSIYL